MAVLDDAARIKVWAIGMRRKLAGGLTKPEWRAAIDATDAWIEANQGSFNTALPAVAQGNLTAQEKTILFCLVAMERAGLLES